MSPIWATSSLISAIYNLYLLWLRVVCLLSVLLGLCACFFVLSSESGIYSLLSIMIVRLLSLIVIASIRRKVSRNRVIIKINDFLYHFFIHKLDPFIFIAISSGCLTKQCFKSSQLTSQMISKLLLRLFPQIFHSKLHQVLSFLLLCQ